MSRPRALVTGGARRVGRAIVLELARAGFDVAIHYRTGGDEAEAVAALARDLGAEAWTVGADLAEVADCAQLVEAVAARWDGLELLVNNASAFTPEPFEHTPLEAYERMMAVHARAPWLLVQGLLPRLRAARSPAAEAAAGEHALVVNLVDIGAVRPLAGYAAYSVSKAALLMLTRALAVELAPAVRCVGVSPGQVIWPEDYDEALREKLARRIPMGRVGTPEDVARFVRFAALEGTYLNGVVLDVDGGLAVRY